MNLQVPPVTERPAEGFPMATLRRMQKWSRRQRAERCERELGQNSTKRGQCFVDFFFGVMFLFL